MRIERIVIFILYPFIGYTLGTIGVTVIHWQFWASMLSVLSIDILSHRDGMRLFR